MIKQSVRFFNGKKVRAIWDYKNDSWWYSANDIITILVEPSSPRRYWNNVKNRNNIIIPFVLQKKLYSNDGKKYLTDCLNAKGIDLLINIIPSKYKNELKEWFEGKNDPIDEQSKRNAYELYESGVINEVEVGTTKGLQQIHAFLFEGLYDFAGKIRTKTISKEGFLFANGNYLPQILKEIDNMPDNTFDEIVNKYTEMNVAHPFMEGNGRATRIWLDILFKNKIHKCVDWSKIEKKEYLDAMRKSPNDSKPIYSLLLNALTDKIDDRDIYMKGIDYSYYYEEIE